MITVSIIDDDPRMISFFRKATFEASEVTCIKTAVSVEEYLVRPIRDDKQHYLFLDLHLEENLSLTQLPNLRARFPEIEIIMYSVDEQYRHLISAFRLGAVGYIIKNFEQQSLINFFNILKAGGAAISPQMAKKLISGIVENNSINTQKLNAKEYNILSSLAAGWSYQYIADSSDMTVNGVRYYIKKIYKKLRVNSRAEAVNVFRDLGSVDTL